MSRKKSFLGEFEELVLLAVWRLGEDAYVVRIQGTLEKVAGRYTSIGAVYATLDRLEEKGYVTAILGEAEQSGRLKRYFKIQESGVAALKEVEEMRNRLMPTRDLEFQA